MIRRLGYLGVQRVAVELARNVFEVFLMLAALGTGLVGLLEPTQVAPGDPILPVWGRLVWYGGLTIGATVSLTGLAMPLPTGAYVERAGLLTIMGPGLSYVVLASVSDAPAHALMVATFIAALGVRIYYLRWEPKAIAAAVRLIKSDVDGEL